METVKKYEFTGKITQHGNYTLFQIRALRDIAPDVRAGDTGGYIHGEHALTQNGDCWVYPNSKVYDAAVIMGNAKIRNSQIGHFACVTHNAEIQNTYLSGKVRVEGQVYMTHARVEATAGTIIGGNINISISNWLNAGGFCYKSLYGCSLSGTQFIDSLHPDLRTTLLTEKHKIITFTVPQFTHPTAVFFSAKTRRVVVRTANKQPMGWKSFMTWVHKYYGNDTAMQINPLVQQAATTLIKIRDKRK